MNHNNRGWFTKPVSVLLAAFLLCGTTACNGNNNSGSITDSSSEVFDPVPVPEDGWTVESLSKTIRINGKALPEPFTVENLVKEYNVKLSSTGNVGNLRFGNKDIAVVILSKDEEGDYQERTITHMLLNDPAVADIITVNGVGIGSSSDEIKNNLGEYFVPQLTESNDSLGFSGFYYSNNTWDDSAWDDGWGDNTWILDVSFDSSNKVKLMNFNFEQ